MSIATARDEALSRLRWARRNLADAEAKATQARHEIEFWEPLVDGPEDEIKAVLDQRRYHTRAASPSETDHREDDRG